VFADLTATVALLSCEEAIAVGAARPFAPWPPLAAKRVTMQLPTAVRHAAEPSRVRVAGTAIHYALSLEFQLWVGRSRVAFANSIAVVEGTPRMAVVPRTWTR
jgi:hypothetical protein